MYGTELTGTLYKPDLMRFNQSIKKYQGRSFTSDLKLTWPRIKYYCVGEYGSKTRRPHYHGIYFNIHPKTLQHIAKDGWDKGNVHVGSVTDKSINYVTKYIIDRDYEHEDQKPFSMMSKGLGESYLQKNAKWHTDAMRGYMMHQGRRIAMPRYYKDRIFSEEEKDLLAKGAIKIADEKYFQELDRLEQMGVIDPLGYLKDQKQYEHDKIRIKSQKLNSL